MKQNVMKQWVKALRSGKFKQGQGTLKQFNKKGQEQHCCLGVLCELYNQQMKKSKKKTLLEETIYIDADFSYGYSIFDTKKEDLPKEVKDWSGIKTSLGRFEITKTDEDGIEDYEVETLADLNDLGKKFKTIANIIEKNYEVL